MLDARKGEALLAVIDSGSFEQAAAMLHLTPSAVSQRVSAMESELGTPLLVRGKPCRATHAGQRVVQYLRRLRLLDAEFMAEHHGEQGAPISVSLAVNNDSLATWLLPALSPYLQQQRILLDIALDDQDHTFALLAQGKVMAGVSSEATAMRGCTAEALGRMRYRMLASPKFAQRWFPHGLQRDAARQAPLMVFDRKDNLQAHFLLKVLGLPQGSYPCHYIGSSEPFMKAIELGLGYGMLPDLQTGDRVTKGKLIDLAPGTPTDVALYWHAWRVQSPKLDMLSKQVVAAAQQVLLPPA